MMRISPPFVLVAMASLGRLFAAEAAGPAAEGWRRPSDAVLLANESRLAVANESTGTVTLFEVGAPPTDGPSGQPALEWRSESQVGGRLTSLAAAPGSAFLLATSSEDHSVLLLRSDGERVVRCGEIQVAPYPVQVAVARDGRTALVTSLWSRTLTILTLDPSGDPPQLSIRSELPLPFPPRLVTFLPGEDRACVADAFGGKLAVINCRDAQLESVRDLPGSNVGGLALSRDGSVVAVSHQITNGQARTNNDDIHWGVLVQNVIRLIELDGLLDPEAVLFRRSRIVHLGQPGSGVADPAGLVDLGTGEWGLAVSGVDEVIVTRADAAIRAHIPVGDRPRVIVADDTRQRGFVVNQLSDSISVVDLQDGELITTVPLGATPSLTAAARGERLFYDASLSHDGWLSCHSCHVEGHTTGRLIDTLGDNSFGTPKRILSLLGTRDANPWGWTGEFRELHGQVRQSVTSSMQGPAPSPTDVNDLVAFLHTLAPAPPETPPQTAQERALVERGGKVFREAGCAGCHVPSLTYTSDQVFDVGLADETGVRKFNPPSLRGVSQQEALFHDGRASSLEEVLVSEGHQLTDPLSDADLQALLQFLRSL